MKIDFLPKLQMGYNSFYGECDDTVDPHICTDCDDIAVENARIRKGAWVHRDAYAVIAADPTDPALWQSQIDLGLVIILPELRGSYDGGSPKMVAGYGDRKEKYLGSDFKAVLTDPVYAANWNHYYSLVGKTQWHLAYVTATKVRLTTVPVTVAPKDPITENLEDEVVWVSDVTWFEYFPPKPFDTPVDIFNCF